jgi:predicted heme/steroid binding protein
MDRTPGRRPIRGKGRPGAHCYISKGYFNNDIARIPHVKGKDKVQPAWYLGKFKTGEGDLIGLLYSKGRLRVINVPNKTLRGLPGLRGLRKLRILHLLESGSSSHAGMNKSSTGPLGPKREKHMNKLIVALIAVGFLFVLGCTQKSETPPVTGMAAAKIGGQQQTRVISIEELSLHDSQDDCWVVYEGKVYDITGAPRHPNMEKAFFSHCGGVSGFEEAAKARHNSSNENRVENYAAYVGELK